MAACRPPALRHRASWQPVCLGSLRGSEAHGAALQSLGTSQSLSRKTCLKLASITPYDSYIAARARRQLRARIPAPVSQGHRPRGCVRGALIPVAGTSPPPGAQPFGAMEENVPGGGERAALLGKAACAAGLSPQASPSEKHPQTPRQGHQPQDASRRNASQAFLGEPAARSAQGAQGKALKSIRSQTSIRQLGTPNPPNPRQNPKPQKKAPPRKREG